MNSLYGKKLSKVFDKMYQGFIDYTMEYKFYAALCKSQNAQTILEIGCGTGNLAAGFSRDFQEYVGLDYSENMLALAKKKNPESSFVQGDMRNFSLTKKFDAALITGRSINYILTDYDLRNTFSSIFRTLHPKGCVIFDFIDAARFIPYITENPWVKHESFVEGLHYSRESSWYLEKGLENTINWSADYYLNEDNSKVLLGNDSSLFRVFAKSEIKSYLEEIGYKVLKQQNRPSYAFDTFVVVAQRV